MRRGKTAETLTFTMPDTAEDAALLQALNNAIDDISPDLKVTGIVDIDKEARIRRVNLLEILAEENENVHPPPDDIVNDWYDPSAAENARPSPVPLPHHPRPVRRSQVRAGHPRLLHQRRVEAPVRQDARADGPGRAPRQVPRPDGRRVSDVVPGAATHRDRVRGPRGDASVQDNRLAQRG